jgi:PadR family transcriptional regulator PadR
VAKSQAELLPGTLEMMVLQTLASGPMYGYAIAKEIRSRSGEVLDVEQGSLYPALFRMERRGWVKTKWGSSETGRRVKYYRLTRAGQRELESQESAWSTFVQAVGQVMTGG